MSDDEILGAAVGRLYAVAPEEFVATRTALVTELKRDGNAVAAKGLGRLRRPSVAAWALNHLVRVAPDIVGDLLGLGVRMRAAQGALDVGTLQHLRAERDRLVDALVSAAADQADEVGRPLSSAVRDEVRASAVAALADQSAADALASGVLTRSLSYSGFGEVDLRDAVVRTTSGHILSVLPGGGLGAEASPGARSPADDGSSPQPDTPSPRALAEDALADAESELASAGAALTTREREQAEAQARADEASHLLSQAQQRVARTAAALTAAQTAYTDAARRHRVAERARHSAATMLKEALTES